MGSIYFSVSGLTRLKLRCHLNDVTLSGDSGDETASKLLHIVSRIQFLMVGLRSHLPFTDCHLEAGVFLALRNGFDILAHGVLHPQASNSMPNSLPALHLSDFFCLIPKPLLHFKYFLE